MSAYDLLFEHLLTRIDPETAHHAGFTAIRTAGPVLGRVAARPRPTVVRRLGLDFPGLLGLAAGFDKSGTGIDALAGLGFGFLEIGTVTALAQPGNPRPRLFRLPADHAVVNRMGFNNDGAAVVAARLAARRRSCPVPLGINIGKSKVTPEEDAVEDYRTSARLLAAHADYLVVNVSSPNTPGLRNLQAVERLEPLLAGVRAAADAASPDRRVPLLVKIAPDLCDDDVLAVADLSLALDLDGVVATNTTIAREGLRSDPDAVAATGAGGLSGAPLRARALEVTRLLRARLGPGPTLIGVGGIDDVAAAQERLAAGADLLQAYTGFVYGGALWPRRMNRRLNRRLAPATSRSEETR